MKNKVGIVLLVCLVDVMLTLVALKLYDYFS
jgi:hypothetical protein